MQEVYCPHHEEETLFVVEENNKGFYKKCNRMYLFSSIERLRKPGLKSTMIKKARTTWGK
tara:strand:- start:90 stop:269 length:180 start_codon:yes stop_codon:yes gene_type:complete